MEPTLLKGAAVKYTSVTTSMASTLALIFGYASIAEAAKIPLLTEVPQAVANNEARLIKQLPGSQRLRLAINLTLRNQSALTQLLQQLYDRQSPSYHRYLSVEQFTEQFGPTQVDYDSVVAWARAQHLVVTGTTRNRHIVDVEGTVEEINHALNVTLGVYQHPTESRTFYAPDREPQLSLAVPVLKISGLDDFTLPRRLSKHGTQQQVARAVANTAGSGPSGVFLPSDMRAAYYGSGPLTGAGQTIGVFSFDGYVLDDVNVFYQNTGMTSNVPINNVLVNGHNGICGKGGLSCDDGEQVLDIVNAIGMAPGITQVLFYEGYSGPDILNQMATDNIAKILSCSWISPDLGTEDDPIFEEFQAQGQTFLNATGDSGAFDDVTWLPPALNPLTLQVGGTSLMTSGPNGTWSSESGWADGGGGFLADAGYSIPTYQQIAGVINASNGGSSTLRNDPDVSAEADFDNATVSNGQLQIGWGGTSFAAPRWAGFIALANEQSIGSGGTSLGFVNPSIYSIATGPNYSSDFHDVTDGTNPAWDDASLFYTATTGYDLVTGWGSPNGSNLIDDLSGAATPGFVLSAYPTNPSTTQSASGQTTISVADLGAFGGTVSFSASGLPASVTASFNPSSSSQSSVLTLTATGAAAVGKVTPVTITGTSGALTRSTTVNLFVGNPPAITVAPAAVTLNTVAQGFANSPITISNGVNSVPLTYSVVLSQDLGCINDPPAWLAAPTSSLALDGGQSGALDIQANPSAAALGVGAYGAFVCIISNDTNNAQVSVPVTLRVLPGPAFETIFESGLEAGETNGASVATYVIDQPVVDDGFGSSINLVTGWYHPYSLVVLDNVNFSDDGLGLSAYWYVDVLSGNGSPFASQVGGAADGGGDYAVLHSGDVVGPASTFVNGMTATNSELVNFFAGVDGYVGIAFVNDQTNQLNYGYVHVLTNSPNGFPAQVLDYGYDSTGGAIKIP
jgi:xanthomonalisin